MKQRIVLERFQAGVRVHGKTEELGRDGGSGLGHWVAQWVGMR